MITIIFFLRSPTFVDRSMTFKDRVRQFDLVGSVLLLPAVICLLVALQLGGVYYAWSDGRIIALFIVFCLLVIAFVFVQAWKGENATIPPRFLRQRSISFGCLFSFLLGGSFFTMVYLIPIWFQAIKGASATQSGIMSIALLLSMVLFLMVCGIAITLCGIYTQFFYISCILSSVGAGLLSTLTPTAGPSKWIGYQVVYGMGIGAGFQLPIVAAQVVLPLADVPIGTSLMVFFLSLGGAVFTSVSQNVFINELVQGVERVTHYVRISSIVETGATELLSTIPTEISELVRPVYNTALTRAWYVATALSVLSILGAFGMEWRTVKREQLIGTI